MKKIRWANIICDAKMKPNMLIVTDGEWQHQVPVSNSKLSLVKRTAHAVFGVAYSRIFVTQVLGDVTDNQQGN